MRRAKFAKEHGQRVRLLTGGAPGTPDAQRLRFAPSQALRLDDVALEHAERGRFAEEVALANREFCQQCIACVAGMCHAA